MAHEAALQSAGMPLVLVTGHGSALDLVLSGGSWKDEDAASRARQGQLKSDYVVITHLKPTAEPWTPERWLARTVDGKCLGTLAATWPVAKRETGVPESGYNKDRCLRIGWFAGPKP
jgi:hypothetical protein